MKITKSELREMIREAIREELNTKGNNITEGAYSGGYAEGGNVIDRYARPGASTQPSKNNYLTRLKSKNPELVGIIKVKGKDIKPGMITQAGQVKEAEVRKTNSGETKVYIMHTNDYDGFWDVNEDMEVLADPENKSKPFAGAYKDLLKMGLKESVTEGIFDKFKKKPQEKEEPKQEEPKKEEPKKEQGFETYTYDEWIQALEYGHKYYAEDGPAAGRMKLWDKAMEIAASENLCKDVIACMDAWMKQEGSKNFPHKSYAKHLKEDLDVDNIFEGLFNF